MSVKVKKAGPDLYSVNGKMILTRGPEIITNHQLNMFEYVCLTYFIRSENDGLRLQSSIKLIPAKL